MKNNSFISSFLLTYFLLFGCVSYDVNRGDRGELPWFEFTLGSSGDTGIGELQFLVVETSHGFLEERLHTVFFIKAEMLESSIKELEKGDMFEAMFDRWISIFDAPKTHPLEIGDIVTVSVQNSEEFQIEGILKKLERPNNPVEDNSS